MTEETAAPVEGQAAEPIVADTAPAASWVDGLSDDLKTYVDAKGFKDPASLTESYRNLEKLRGVPEDRLLKLPEKADEPGALDSVYDKLGRPDAPEKYTRVLGEEFNDDVFKGISAEAHKLGLNDKQFAGLQKITGDLATGVLEQQEQQSAAAFDAWKDSNAKGFQDAARVMAEVGINEEQLAGVLAGDKTQLYDFLAKVAGRSSEPPVINGDAPGDGFQLSPSQAKVKIAELMIDEAFMKNYTASSQKVRQVAIDRMTKLHEIAARG